MEQPRGSGSGFSNPTMKQFPFIVLGVSGDSSKSNSEICPASDAVPEPVCRKQIFSACSNSKDAKERLIYSSPHLRNESSKSHVAAHSDKQIKTISPFTAPSNFILPNRCIPVQKTHNMSSTCQPSASPAKAMGSSGDNIENQRVAIALSKATHNRANISYDGSKVCGEAEMFSEKFEDKKFQQKKPQHKDLLSSVNDNDHLQRVQDKISKILATMQQREDEIFRLKSEVKNLKDVLSKNSTDATTSQNLYYNMQKQLNNIEEKIELQRLDNLHGSITSPSSKVSSSDSIKFEFDFDKFMDAVKLLNKRVENGQTMELCFTTGGASFKRWDGVNITVFNNGLLLDGDKDFLPLSSSRARYFIQDVLDGFFPNEFQNTFPQGVYLVVKDNRKITYNGDFQFSGNGHMLNDTTGLPNLVPGKYLSELKQRQFSLPNSKPVAVSKSPSIDALNKSWTCEVENSLKVLSTLHASYDVLLAKKVLGFDDKMITVKLKNIVTGQCYKLKVSIFAKVEEVIDHLKRTIDIGCEENLVLIQSLPVGVLAVHSATLKDYCVDSNSLLYLRIEKLNSV